jgi:DNA invertase Pin-like site-specific DNA recombinase
VRGVLGDGDTLVVTRLVRLGHSLRDLANVAHEIEETGANLKVMAQAVDTCIAAGRAFFGVLAVFAGSRQARAPSGRWKTRPPLGPPASGR